MFLAWEVRVHWFMRYTSTMTNVVLCKSLGRTGQAKWWRSFSRTGELARVALSCHMALDLLCQEMKDACQESSLSLCSQRSQLSLCSQCLEDMEDLLLPGGQPPWSWCGGLVPVRIRTWQGSEELARGHRCGWLQGSHRVLGGDPRALYKAMMRSICIRLGHSCSRTPCHRVRLHDPGAAM